jgi:hypothetical protein
MRTRKIPFLWVRPAVVMATGVAVTVAAPDANQADPPAIQPRPTPRWLAADEASCRRNAFLPVVWSVRMWSTVPQRPGHAHPGAAKF